MNVMKSKRAQEKYLHDGYQYVFDKYYADKLKTIWRCELKDECKSRLHRAAADGQFILLMNEHNYGSDVAKTEVDKIVNEATTYVQGQERHDVLERELIYVRVYCKDKKHKDEGLEEDSKYTHKNWLSGGREVNNYEEYKTVMLLRKIFCNDLLRRQAMAEREFENVIPVEHKRTEAVFKVELGKLRAESHVTWSFPGGVLKLVANVDGELYATTWNGVTKEMVEDIKIKTEKGSFTVHLIKKESCDITDIYTPK